MAEALENLATKNHVETELDLKDKNRKTWKIFKRMIQVVLLVEVTLIMMRHKII